MRACVIETASVLSSHRALEEKEREKRVEEREERRGERERVCV